MRWWRKTSVGLKVAIIATAIVAVSIVGVLATEQLGRDNDDAATARDTSGASNPGDEVTFRGNPLELGTVAKISSNYRVAVTEISRYETATGQLLAVTIDATYLGKEDGEPWADLSVEYARSGKQTFGESGCPFDTGEEDPDDQATLKTGDETTYAVCVELPDTDLAKGRISVHEAFSTGARFSWSTEEAVTEALPSVAPAGPPAAQAPAPRPQPPRQSDDDDSTATCEDWDDEEYEEYKEYGEQRKKQFEDYRDAGGNNEDLIDDYEDWEEAYDEQMDFLRKYAEAC